MFCTLRWFYSKYQQQLATCRFFHSVCTKSVDLFVYIKNANDEPHNIQCIIQKSVFAISKTNWCVLLLQEDAGTLGLSTGQALVKLRDQLNSLLEQHQRTARRRISAQVYYAYLKLLFVYYWVLDLVHINHLLIIDNLAVFFPVVAATFLQMYLISFSSSEHSQ